MKHSFVYGAIFAFCCATCGAGLVFAEEKGPAEVVIQGSLDVERVAKPAFLPHQAHQWLECEGCHHGKGADGKRVEYVAGQKIEKCETCHNTKVKLPEKVATLKLAGHVLCMECHRKNDAALTKCGVCHTKM